MNRRATLAFTFLALSLVLMLVAKPSPAVQSPEHEPPAELFLSDEEIDADTLTGATPAILRDVPLVPPVPEVTAADLYPVIRVIDGDTIVVELAGKPETIRLIGVDTPETVHPSKSVQCFGIEASMQMKTWLADRQVRFEYDPTQDERDKYGRLLAYVFRDDGLFVNKELIAAGYGHEYTYRLPYRYQAEFRQAEASARQYERGLWAPAICEDSEQF